MYSPPLRFLLRTINTLTISIMSSPLRLLILTALIGLASARIDLKETKTM